MPDFSCAVNDISTDTTCSDRGGWSAIFLADQSTIDWTAMALGANYDDATFSVLNWIMLSGNWAEITAVRKNGSLQSTYTVANDFYTVEMNNIILKGHTAARTIAIGQLIACCGLVMQYFDNNGIARVIGKEYINGAWVDAVDPVRIARHLESHGVFGSEDDRARDELDFAGEHSFPMPYSSVDLATMRTL